MMINNNFIIFIHTKKNQDLVLLIDSRYLIIIIIIIVVTFSTCLFQWGHVVPRCQPLISIGHWQVLTKNFTISRWPDIFGGNMKRSVKYNIYLFSHIGLQCCSSYRVRYWPTFCRPLLISSTMRLSLSVHIQSHEVFKNIIL